MTYGARNSPLYLFSNWLALFNMTKNIMTYGSWKNPKMILKSYRDSNVHVFYFFIMELLIKHTRIKSEGV